MQIMSENDGQNDEIQTRSESRGARRAVRGKQENMINEREDEISEVMTSLTSPTSTACACAAAFYAERPGGVVNSLSAPMPSNHEALKGKAVAA